MFLFEYNMIVWLTRILKNQSNKIPMSGKAGGWASGIELRLGLTFWLTFFKAPKLLKNLSIMFLLISIMINEDNIFQSF